MAGNELLPSANPEEAEVPPGQGLGIAMPPGAGAASLVQPLDLQHGEIAAAYGKMKDAFGRIDSARQALGALTRMGDMVEPEDVIREAGSLVAKGFDPRALATTLADMPPNGGQALAAWLGTKVQGLTATEARAKPQLESLRHHLGMSALRLLAAHHFEGQAALAAPAKGRA